jgi:hypothetical protein
MRQNAQAEPVICVCVKRTGSENAHVEPVIGACVKRTGLTHRLNNHRCVRIAHKSDTRVLKTNAQVKLILGMRHGAENSQHCP